jgi:hypothetical protein
VQDQLYSRLDTITAGVFGQLMYDDEPLDTVLLGLLGHNCWGEQALAVDSYVRSFLVAAWAAREVAVAARELAAALEVTLDAVPEHQPAPLSVRVRLLVGPAAGAEWGAGEQICTDCHLRRQADSMLQCHTCTRWYHRACAGVAGPVPELDWVCNACVTCVVMPTVAALSPGGSTQPAYQPYGRGTGPGWLEWPDNCKPLALPRIYQWI